MLIITIYNCTDRKVKVDFSPSGHTYVIEPHNHKIYNRLDMIRPLSVRIDPYYGGYSDHLVKQPARNFSMNPITGYIYHDGSTGSITLNDPADGDIKIGPCP